MNMGMADDLSNVSQASNARNPAQNLATMPADDFITAMTQRALRNISKGKNLKKYGKLQYLTEDQKMEYYAQNDCM